MPPPDGHRAPPIPLHLAQVDPAGLRYSNGAFIAILVSIVVRSSFMLVFLSVQMLRDMLQNCVSHRYACANESTKGGISTCSGGDKPTVSHAVTEMVSRDMGSRSDSIVRPRDMRPLSNWPRTRSPTQSNIRLAYTGHSKISLTDLNDRHDSKTLQ